MLIKTIAATAAFAMLMAGGQAIAAQKTAPQGAAPKQPIPYSQLDAYTKATPKVRASKDWWAGQAQTGLSTDTSATAATGAEPSPALPSTSTAPGTGATTTPSMSPPSMPVTPPTNAPAIEEKSPSSAPGAPAMPPGDTPAGPK